MPTAQHPLPIALSGKIGPPLFTATFVHCLLTADMKLLHVGLIVVGLLLMIVEHWYSASHGE